MAQDLEVHRLPTAGQLARQSELSEPAFYALYSWCLNPILPIAGLVKRLLEELDRYPQLVAAWQREESRINLYLFVCAIACTVDDYLAWEPWNLTRVAVLPLALRPLASGILWLSNSLSALRHVREDRRVGRWRRDWERCVDQACQLLLSGDQSIASEWAALESSARQQLAPAPFPADLRERRMRIPEGFRCQDLAHQDVLWLAQRFVESGRGRAAPLVVIGARTAGAYFGPLVRAALSRRGWPQASCFTVRPKSGLSRWEWSQIKSLGHRDTHVVLVDDYPNTGITFPSDARRPEQGRGEFRSDHLALATPRRASGLEPGRIGPAARHACVDRARARATSQGGSLEPGLGGAASRELLGANRRKPRLTNFFEIDSRVGIGTVVMVKKWKRVMGPRGIA